MLGNIQTAVGIVPKGTTTAFVGRMSDISVWRKVLSTLEVQVLLCPLSYWVGFSLSISCVQQLTLANRGQRLLFSHPAGTEANLVAYFSMKQPENQQRELDDDTAAAAVGHFNGDGPLLTRLALIKPLEGQACQGFQQVPVPCAPPNW